MNIEGQLPFDTSPDVSRAPIAREEAEAAINDLFRRAMTTGDSSAWMRGLLRFIRDMRRYSVFNAKLIFLQRPGAVSVGTVRYWAQRHRSIRPGAMPIIILAPNGPIAIVYEMEDTEGPTQDPLFGALESRQVRTVAESDLRAFISGIEAIGCSTRHPEGLFLVAEEGLGTGRPGDVHYRRDRMERFVIRINRNLSATERFLTLIHELAHVMCGHMGPHPRGWWPDRLSFAHLPESMRDDLREFEAEAVAWIIASRCGLTSNAPDYLADKVAPLDAERLDINAVLDAANRIEPLTGLRRQT